MLGFTKLGPFERKRQPQGRLPLLLLPDMGFHEVRRNGKKSLRDASSRAENLCLSRDSKERFSGHGGQGHPRRIENGELHALVVLRCNQAWRERNRIAARLCERQPNHPKAVWQDEFNFGAWLESFKRRRGDVDPHHPRSGICKLEQWLTRPYIFIYEHPRV